MILLHGSHRPHSPGSVLLPMPGFSIGAGSMAESQVLELLRPANCLPHAWAVFMTDREADLDNCGACLDHVHVVNAAGSVSRHDLNWATTIAMALDRFDAPSVIDEAAPEIAAAARAYWSGMPHPDGPVWEYLAGSAEVLVEVPVTVSADQVMLELALEDGRVCEMA